MTTTDPAPTTTLPAQYSPGEVEAGLYEGWESRGYFTADAASDREPFSIVIPPPNVTGGLHLGHAFEHTLMDALVRRARMQGKETLWVPGMDHASIAVHALVEKELAEEGTDRRALGREAFIERVWQWKAAYGGQILDQMRRLGDSVDWTRERFTLDEGFSRAVQTMFKRLYDEGLIYRAERLVNWSPVLRSVLSDAEVDHREVEGELVSIRYGAADGSGPSLIVATTRVETMLGDTAVAVHPDDERYAALIGTDVELPLTGRRIPVIADGHVDPQFGTGAVKVTPAHDPNDFAIGQRHGLPMPTIMDDEGRITATGTDFDGMDRFEARVAVRERLREQGRIVAEQRPYLHSVGHSERSKEPIEPRLSLQWFVAVDTLARAAGTAVRDGRVAISPPELAARYFAWVDHLHDWCISRQLWWGHRIPVWYSPDGTEQICLGPGEEPPAGWRQDEDVLDTWFSAGLWPFSTLGWPDDTADLRRFYPTTVLVTGYDILFFWVVRMMMFSVHAEVNEPGSVPFGTVALHGMLRDKQGRKMSKSRGNGVDPLDWMDAYGTDATRFTFARCGNPGADAPVSEELVQSSRSFCTKLWNATRFALLNGATTDGEVPSIPTGADAWITGRLQQVVADVDRLYADFEFAKIADLLYHFAWDEVCDWYLELAKVTLTGDDEGAADATRRVLGEVLDVLLRLLHPLMPFLTERLWIELTGRESVVVAAWPQADFTRVAAGAEREIAGVRDVVTEVRRFRSDQGLKPSQRVPARVDGPLGDYQQRAVRHLLRLTEPGPDFTVTAALTTAAGVRIELDLSRAIDVAAERARLTKDRAAATKELEQAAAKLGNEAFLAKAPEKVVLGIRARREAAESELARVGAALSALPVG
ncbi:MAG: valine--tRNA ligase [bacterium]